MAGLGDILAATATGQNPDYQSIQANAALRGAQFQDTMAQVPLRGAQTSEALANADKARIEALANQRKLDAIDALKTKQAQDPTYKPTLGELIAIDPNTQQATAGAGNLADQGYQATLGNPHANPADQLAAEQALTHKVVNPYVALPPNYTDLRTPGAPGAPAPQHLSEIGEATVGSKDAATNLANAKAGQIMSTDNSVDPNEMAYHAHLFNTTGKVPSFGMGQSALRQYFLKAAYLDAAGIPITAQALGIPTDHIANHIPAPAAGGAAGPNPGGNPNETPATLAAAGTYPASNPADNAPAALPGQPTTVPGAAPQPAPLSPREAAENTAGAQADTKAANAAMTNSTKMMTTVQAQAYTAHQSYQLALQYAAQLAQQRGPDGSPLINKAFIDWKNGVTGDPLTGQFVHELTVAHDEYAKIVSGATGAQGITDRGREAADKLFNQNMNLDTLQAIGGTMDYDMNNRRVGYVNAIAAARKGIVNPDNYQTKFEQDRAATNAAANPGTVHISSDAEYTKLPSGTKFIGPDGKLRTKP